MFDGGASRYQSTKTRQLYVVKFYGPEEQEVLNRLSRIIGVLRVRDNSCSTGEL